MAFSILGILVVGGILMFGLVMVVGGVVWALSQRNNHRASGHIPTPQHQLDQHHAQHNNGIDPMTGAAMGLAAGAMLHADQHAANHEEPIIDAQTVTPTPEPSVDPVDTAGPEIASNDFFDAGGFDGGGFDAGGDF